MPGLSLPDGTPTGGVYGFASIAIELIKKIEPDYVAVAWDKPKTNIRKRLDIYPQYKAGRKPAPADFYTQVPILMELLDAFGWPFYEIDDYEADDIMGTFARQAEERGIETYLLTSDLDSLQLISPLTKVYAIKNGLSNIQEFDVEAFEEKYGIGVEQFLDLKSLKGDSSDNIPGVPGIGEKTALQLLQQYNDLDNIYKNLDNIKPAVAKKLEAGKDYAYLSKQIGRIWTDVPIELDWDIADVEDIDLQRVADILDRLKFSSLVRRLPKNMQLGSSSPSTIDDSLASAVASEASVKEEHWPEVFSLGESVLVGIFEGDFYVSPNKETVYRKPVTEIDANTWTAFGWSKVLSYSIKDLYHQLNDVGVEVAFSSVHDIRQAAFLINPLERDHSLKAVAGSEEELTSIVYGLWGAYEAQADFFKNTPEIGEIAEKFDFPLTKILFDMEKRGVGVDVSVFEKLSVELGEELSNIEQEIYTLVGSEFNIASPAQLSEVLFTKLQLPTTGIKKGKTAYSTGQKELDKLRGQHPIIELIERSRELAKLKNTYVDALPKLVDENGRIHSTFNQDVTATGRLSSTQPNLQNIPIRTEQGRKIREAFVASEGNVLVSADYSQFELRLAAVLADDKQLIEDFNGSVDVHTKTAAQVYGISLEDVSKDQRRAAKVINFGVLYGMSPHGLSVATGMSMFEAKNFIDQYFELRAPIRKFIDDTLQKAKEDGFVSTYYGRRRPTPDILSSNFMVRAGAERAAANMPIQGTEADLMKRAMLKVDEAIGSLGEQILQIHDSILIECPAENADKIAAILKEIMQEIAPELPIRLDVDVSIGKSWGDL